METGAWGKFTQEMFRYITEQLIMMCIVQWLVGFLTFMLPFAKHNFRAFLLPIHVYVGAILFFFVIATSYAGMTQLLLSMK